MLPNREQPEPALIDISEGEPKVDIKDTKMDEEMQAEAVRVAKRALRTCTTTSDAAKKIKRTFDNEHEPIWECVVGTEFGAHVTHEADEYYTYFYVGRYAVLLFRVSVFMTGMTPSSAGPNAPGTPTQAVGSDSHIGIAQAE